MHTYIYIYICAHRPSLSLSVFLTHCVITPVAVRMTLLDVEIIVRDSATENRSLFYFVFCFWTLSKVIVCDNATKKLAQIVGL